LVELSDVELIKHVWLALGQLDEGYAQSESNTNKARIYRVYETELPEGTMRNVLVDTLTKIALVLHL